MKQQPSKVAAVQANERKPSSPQQTSDLISHELEVALHLAFVDARTRRHEYISVEHLLLALTNATSTQETLKACQADLDELRSALSSFIDEQHVPVAEGKDDVDSQPTIGFQRVVQRAIMQVQTSGRRSQVTCNNALVAIFGEKDSHAVYYLHQQGVTRLDVINYVKDGVSKRGQHGTEKEPSSTTVEQELFNLVADAAQPYVLSPARKSEQPKLFISYCHADSPCLDRLLVHLKPLERTNTVICWSDRRLRTGDKWRAELEQNLNESVIAILLLSADFLASDFIVNNELPPLLIKADSKGLRILPVILKPCGFRRDPILSTFQSANDPTLPLLGLSLIEQEWLYDKVADEVAKEISARRSGQGTQMR